jgi:uncharacterized protein HemX
MAKFIAVILFLALGFGAGYYVGSNRMIELRKDVERLETEATERAVRFQQEMEVLRHRNHLMEAREKINEAQKALNERNFGSAQKAIQTAQEEIREAQKSAPASEKGKYSGLLAGLADIGGDLAHPTRPQLRQKMERAVQDLDQLAVR